MKNRIDLRFDELRPAGRRGLIPFFTAGDPLADSTVPLMHALVRGGADLLELGIPFSDPMADGPVIQASSERAIKRGVSLRSILDMVADFRRDDSQTPVILMGYMNPVERMGYAEFATAAGGAGVDGLLLVDCPPEEAGVLRQRLMEKQIHQIYLVAPTTTDARCQSICQVAGGFIYYVSLKGITGAQASNESGLAEHIAMIRSHSELPVAVGFGIKDGHSAALAAQAADAVVLGSALVERLQACDSLESACRAAEVFVANLRSALDNVDNAIAC
nr:putative tryptophan synthase subunit alpha [uncultured bacterium]